MAEAFDFDHRHAADAYVAKRLFDFFKLERLDYGFNFFHGRYFRSV